MTETSKQKAPWSIKGANAPNVATPVVPTIAINLDWMRYTKPYNAELSLPDNLRIAVPRDPAFVLTGEMIPNAKGYDSAMKLSIGVIHWHSKMQSQGVSVELGGANLATMRALGASDDFLIQHIGLIQGKVSTMDSAIDVYNHDAQFVDILLLDELGCLETTARMVNAFTGRTRTGDKVTTHGGAYIGSPKSPRQIKVYNKAAEQGTPDKDWTRIEMRWRGRHARAAHIAMLEFGIAATTRKAVISMLNADIEWFQTAVTGDLATIEPVRRLETDTREWLIKLIAPLLERELIAERAQNEADLFNTFDALLKDEYNARGRKVARRNKR